MRTRTRALAFRQTWENLDRRNRLCLCSIFTGDEKGRKYTRFCWTLPKHTGYCHHSNMTKSCLLKWNWLWGDRLTGAIRLIHQYIAGFVFIRFLCSPIHTFSSPFLSFVSLSSVLEFASRQRISANCLRKSLPQAGLCSSVALRLSASSFQKWQHEPGNNSKHLLTITVGSEQIGVKYANSRNKQLLARSVYCMEYVAVWSNANNAFSFCSGYADKNL